MECNCDVVQILMYSEKLDNVSQFFIQWGVFVFSVNRVSAPSAHSMMRWLQSEGPLTACLDTLSYCVGLDSSYRNRGQESMSVPGRETNASIVLQLPETSKFQPYQRLSVVAK